MKTIKFSKNYHKFEDDIFTTIRGKTYPKRKKLKKGDKVLVITPNDRFQTVVKNIEYKKIKDISLQLLKRDGEYEGYEIQSVDDFIKLLNSLQKYYVYTKESIVSIIYLKKEKNN